MRCRLTFFVSIMLLSFVPLQAQQWNGSSDANGLIYRNGYVGISMANPNAHLVVGDEFGATVSGSGGGLGVFGSNLAVFDAGANNNLLYTPNTHATFGFAAMRTSWGKVEFFTMPGSTTAGNLVTPTARMIINPNGNVGIGGAPTADKLFVDGNILAKQTIMVMKDGGWRVSMNGLADGYVTGRSDDLATMFMIRSKGSTYFNGGNVGIGTTTPVYKLDVQGGLRAGNPVSSPSYQDHLVVLSDGNVAFEGEQIFANKEGSGVHGIKFSSAYSLTSDPDFRIGVVDLANPTVFTKDYLYLNNGNVGIGTTSPNERLTVNGTVYAKEVKVDLNVPGPDYVFEKGYPLPSLAEVKKFIDENKHLPEVPSAKEMEENGVKVGEMEMVLLRKVEELTLYVIEQNKLIAQLQDQSAVSSGAMVKELSSELAMMKEKMDAQDVEIMKLRKHIETLTTKTE